MHARENNFDLIRLVLASLVMLAHGNALLGVDWDHVLLQQAGLAVHGFFIVSGFLITWSVDRHFELRSYTIKRFARIYPLYFVVVMIQLVLLWWLSQAPNTAEALRYLGWNLVFLNFLQPEFGGVIDEPINGSFWTLKVEVMFYISLPILLFVVKRFGTWLLLPCFVMALAWRYGLTELGYPRYAKQLPGAMTLFITGITLYRYGNGIYERCVSKQHRLPKILGAVALLLLYPLHPLIQMILYHAVLGMSLYLIVFKLPTVTISRDISYGIYLWHAPIFVLFGLTGYSAVSLYLAGMVLTVILAYVSSYAVEEPAIKWGQKKAALWRK